ncbi:hypothetical protein D9M71_730580 [compost metagenome]
MPSFGRQAFCSRQACHWRSNSDCQSATTGPSISTITSRQALVLSRADQNSSVAPVPPT